MGNSRETEDGLWEHDEQIHSEHYMLYLMCHGCETVYDEYGNIKTIHIKEGVPDFTPPKRISKEGFVYEQRKLLLPILMDCFEKNPSKMFYFKRNEFRKQLGI